MPNSIKIASAGRLNALKGLNHISYNCMRRLSPMALVITAFGLYAYPAFTAVRTNHRLYDDGNGIYQYTQTPKQTQYTVVEGDSVCKYPNSSTNLAIKSAKANESLKICLKSATLRDFGAISVLGPETTAKPESESTAKHPKEEVLYEQCRKEFESALKDIVGKNTDVKHILSLQEQANACFKNNGLSKYTIYGLRDRPLHVSAYHDDVAIVGRHVFEIHSSDDIVVPGGPEKAFTQTLVIRGITAKARMTRTEEDQRACGDKDIRAFVEGEAKALVDNNKLSRDSIHSLSDKINECYISHGYVNSGVEIYNASDSRRNTTSGVPETATLYPLQVIEGTLNTINVRYEWEKGYGDDPEFTLHRINSPDGLNAGYVREVIRRGNEGVLNTESLHERFEVLLDDPNIRRVEGALRPGTKPGDSVLDVTVVRAKPYEWTFSLDNRISPRIGAIHGTTGVTLRNLNGWRDELHAEMGASRGLKDYDVRYSAPIPQLGDNPIFYGWQVELHAGSNSSGVTEEPFEQINITGRTMDMDFGLRHRFHYDLNDVDQTDLPKWFTQKRWRGTFDAGISFAHRRSSTKLDNDFFSFTPEADEGRTRITAIRPFIEFNGQDLVGSNVYEVLMRASHGIPWFGVRNSSISPPRFNAVRGVFRWAHRGGLLDELVHMGTEQQSTEQQNGNDNCRGDIKKVRDLALCHEISLRLSGQYAFDRQPSPEKFSVGGVSSVRGFRENTRLYDSGLAGSLEYKIPLTRAFMPDVIGTPSWKRNWDEGMLTAVGFVDVGWGTDRPHTDSAERGRIFWGAGGGLEYALSSALSASVLYGHGFNKHKNYPKGKTLQDNGIYFKITTNTDMFGRVKKSVMDGIGSFTSTAEGVK